MNESAAVRLGVQELKINIILGCIFVLLYLYEHVNYMIMCLVNGIHTSER